MEPDFSKEGILGRMLSSAVDLWGIKHNDNLDPVIRLMMEAFAAEIFKVQQNIQVSNAGLVEHLAEVLTPTKLTSVVPAHGIIHGGCAVNKQVIDKNTTYEVAGGNVKEQKFLFTPIDNLVLYNAEVTSIVTPSSICKVDNCIYKVVTAVPNVGSIPQNHVWLGISLSPHLHNIKGLHFFVEWPNMGSKNELYRNIGLAKWTVNGETPLRVIKGLSYVTSRDQVNDSLEKLETYSLIVDDIKESYHNQFFTIDTTIPELQENILQYPDIFTKYFSEPDLTQFFIEKKLWIRLELPVYLETEILNDMIVNTNCYPIINRELKLMSTNSSILPLVCGNTERILSVGSVYGTINGMYKRIELREKVGDLNTYAFKKAGLERFDRRDAYELVKYLELLLKSEIQAFISIDKGGSQELIEALNVVVNHTRKITKSEEDKALQYVMLEKEILDEVVTAEFWVARCEEANNIPMGAIVQNIKDSSQTNCILLVPTSGGKDSQNEAERIRAYQYALLTKEQIVSVQDIKSFINYQLGQHVLQIEVKSGLMIGQGSKQGLMRSIDIYINTTEEYKEDSTERQLISDILLKKLQQQSDPSRMYRLFWNEMRDN